MYVFSNSSVNAAVLNSIDNFNIQARITGTVNGISFTDANIVGGSFSITNQCSSETELSVGQVYVGELNITLTGLEIDRYSLYGKQIIPTWGIYVNSAWRSVPLGTFIISEVEVVSLGLKIRAYDNMSLFDIPYTPTELSGVPRALALAACTACGVTLGTTATTFATFPNYNVTLNATQTSDIDGNKSIPEISTYRDVIACLAQVTCTNATIDRSGQLIFVPYPSTAVASIDTSHRKMGGMTADFETYYDSIIVTDPATKVQTKYTRSNPSGLTMDLGDNPFINTAAIRNAILNALTFRFHPFRMDILNAPLYDLMDCINLPDGIGDGTKLYCITKYTWTYHGSYQLVGAGQDPKLVAVASAAQRSAAQANFIAAQKVTTDEMDAAIDAATAQITGNNGGYVVLHDSDNDDQPDELLVMNTPSISTATKVWRFNLSGLGHSNNGYSGTYGLALTADGNIVANKVVVGTLGDQAGLNYWNMETGDFQIKALSEYGWNPQVGVLQTYAGEDIQTYAGENIQAYSEATYSMIQTNANQIRLVTEDAAHLQSELNLVPGQITAAVSALEGQIGAELALEIATDSGGHPYGKISANADYIQFDAGDLIINSNQFTLDSSGNATFGGTVTATQVRTGSMVSTNGMATVDLDNARIYVTDASYRRAMLRGDAGSLILYYSTDSGATYTEIGSLWINNNSGRSIANIDTYQVGRYQAGSTAQLRANQQFAEWDYSAEQSYLTANRIRVRTNDGTAVYNALSYDNSVGVTSAASRYSVRNGTTLYHVLTWDSTNSGTKISTAYGSIGDLTSTKITEDSLWGSNGEVIHYISSNNNNVLRAYQYQVGTEADHKIALHYAQSKTTLYADFAYSSIYYLDDDNNPAYTLANFSSSGKAWVHADVFYQDGQSLANVLIAD